MLRKKTKKKPVARQKTGRRKQPLKRVRCANCVLCGGCAGLLLK
jgi:hypothetical protein